MMNRGNESIRQDKLHIRLLDRLEVLLGNKSVSDALQKSKKARALIAYLILRKGEPATYDELCAALWEKETGQNLNNALKVLVCRTRALLAAVDPVLHSSILAVQGAYAWNMEATGEVDVFTIDALCKNIITAQVAPEINDKDLDKLLGLYSPKLLPEMAQMEWVLTRAKQLQEQFTTTIAHVIDLLREASDWEQIIKICRICTDVMPQEERWHEEMMRAFMMLDRRSDAMNQYEQATGYERKRAWGEPSAEIVELYAQAMQADIAMEQDMDHVADELLLTDLGGGALVCDYMIFRHVYQLQQRSLERSGQMTFLAMFKVSSTSNQAVQLLALEEAMQRLGRQLQHNLRRGDTIARYTPSQYVVLLQGSAYEFVKSIMERVRMSFRAEMGTVGIELDYSYKPLLPGGKSNVTLL